MPPFRVPSPLPPCHFAAHADHFLLRFAAQRRRLFRKRLRRHDAMSLIIIFAC